VEDVARNWRYGGTPPISQVEQRQETKTSWEKKNPPNDPKSNRKLARFPFFKTRVSFEK